ncbi:unnamed protein product, partial [marine sediment metagenome]
CFLSRRTSRRDIHDPKLLAVAIDDANLRSADTIVLTIASFLRYLTSP